MNNCVKCGKPYSEKHHVFGSFNRQVSEKNGFVVYLCDKHHRGQPDGIHGGNIELDLMLKRKFQTQYELDHTRLEWITLIGKSYL